MEQNIFESLNGKLDAIKNEQDIVQLKSWFSQEISNIMNILIEITKDNSIALLKKTKQIIINEYSDYNISLQSIADRLNISPGYLSSLFKKVTGENFTNYLISIRMEKAIKHILVGREKVFEIAEKVGYSSARYFNDAFKKRFGVSPLEYKKRIGSNEKSV